MLNKITQVPYLFYLKKTFLFYFKKYYFHKIIFFIFKQQNKKYYYNSKIKKNKIKFLNNFFFKPTKKFFNFVKSKKLFFLNNHLNLFFLNFSKNIEKKLKNNTHTHLNYFLNLENNLINFFFKNFFLFEKNVKLNYSSNFINSFFYNSFFLQPNIKKTPLIFTNYTPYNSLNLLLVEKIFSKLNVNYVPSFYKYIYYGISSSIEFIFKKKFFLKIFSKSFNSNSITDHIDYLFFKNKSIQSRIGRGFFLHEMLDIIYTTFFYKDLNFLIKWFVKTMNRISFLNHKKFLSSFKQILSNNSDFFIKNNNIRGFFFDIRGKVGVTGDSKKRHFSFYVGDFSKTTKKYKFDYQFDVVRTHTGALGITMYLSYK